MKFTSIKQQIQRIGFAVIVTATVYQPALQAQSINQPSPTSPPIGALLTVNPDTSDLSLKTNQTASLVAEEKNSQFTKSTDAAFVGAAHPTSGATKIVEIDGQSYLEFDSEFSSASGPDLLVLLHTDAEPESYSPDNYISLGQLQQVAGAQRYAIPENVDVSAFRSAVIWCREFDVTFGYATL